MGEVWLAEQEQPFRRRVALKLIKTGLDTKHVIARFEAERQALAMMNHQNIAKVLDAGITDEGLPYFAMELVQGHSHHRVLRHQQARAERAAGTVRPNLPSHPACSSEGHHPPGHQTRQRAGHAVRRQAGRQGHRLRIGQGSAGYHAAHQPHAVHAVRPGRRYAGLHEPRAGRDEHAGCRHADRRVFAGRDAVRAANRQHSFGKRNGAAAGLRQAPAVDSRGRTTPAQSAPSLSGEKIEGISRQRKIEPQQLQRSSRAISTGS